TERTLWLEAVDAEGSKGLAREVPRDQIPASTVVHDAVRLALARRLASRVIAIAEAQTPLRFASERHLAQRLAVDDRFRRRQAHAGARRARAALADALGQEALGLAHRPQRQFFDTAAGTGRRPAQPARTRHGFAAIEQQRWQLATDTQTIPTFETR